MCVCVLDADIELSEFLNMDLPKLRDFVPDDNERLRLIKCIFNHKVRNGLASAAGPVTFTLFPYQKSKERKQGSWVIIETAIVYRALRKLTKVDLIWKVRGRTVLEVVETRGTQQKTLTSIFRIW